MDNLTLTIFTSTILFAIGIYGLSTRRNAIRLLMAVEIILNAANLNFIAFVQYLHPFAVQGHIFVLFIIALAAAEVGVGIAIFLSLFRIYASPEVDLASKIKEE